MTDNERTERERVAQADRIAAAPMAVLAEMRELILAGKADHYAEPFARHRIAALRAQGQDERAEIVAWLRADADLTEAEAVKIVRNTTGDPRKNAAEWAGLVATKRGIADAIEAGQHKDTARD